MRRQLTKSQRQYVLGEMLELARYLTGQSVAPPQVRQAVKRLRDDLLTLLREDITDITVDRQSYLVTTDQERNYENLL